MHIQFAAIDTYEHIPRNFFGFKKRNKPTETRIATAATVVVGEESFGGIYARKVKGVKLSDDPRWDLKDAFPADYETVPCVMNIWKLIYGNIAREVTVVDEDSWMSLWHMSAGAGFNNSLGQYMLSKTIPISLYLQDELTNIPDVHFISGMESGKYDILINCPVGEEDTWKLSPRQKQTIFSAHPRYPSYSPNDNTRVKCQKMMEVYHLLTSIKREVENGR